jgi:hypothetical protein
VSEAIHVTAKMYKAVSDESVNRYRQDVLFNVKLSMTASRPRAVACHYVASDLRGTTVRQSHKLS